MISEEFSGKSPGNINDIFLELKQSQSKLDKTASKKLKLIMEKEGLTGLIAPEVNTKPNFSQTAYINEREIGDQLLEVDVFASKRFLSKKQIFIAAIGTAVIGFTLGAKLGLTIYYELSPYETKVTLFDMLKAFF